jgi:hypothetical protein
MSATRRSTPVTRAARAIRPARAVAVTRPARAGTPRGAIPGPFDGYPYLVTRIGRAPLRHLALVPADWPRERLVDLARRQALANQLPTCLCLGPADAVYVEPGREPARATLVPVGLPVTDRLVLADPLRETAELAARRAALAAYVSCARANGHLVGDGLEGGRPATAEDVARLSGRGEDGPGEDRLPPGLRRCPACGQPRGEHLPLRGLTWDERSPQVVEVHCRCTNRNRCAGCGGPLADQRLSAYYWDEDRRGVWYVAAYCGLGHRCPPAG